MRKKTKTGYKISASFMILMIIIIGTVMLVQNNNENETQVTVPGIADTSSAVAAEPVTGSSGTEQEASEINGDLNELVNEIKEYISGFTGTYGIYYINLETKDEFGINDSEGFVAASTSKLPVNMYLYRKIEKGSVDPGQILIYTKEDYAEGTGSIQNMPFGTEYTVREASRLSVEESDNCGINMLIRLLGIKNIRRYMVSLGGTIYYDEKHLTCPRDMAVYMKELYDFWLDDPDVAGELMHDLENTIYNDRINALLPKKIVVAHKIGNQIDVMNDVGLVFADQPYILSVLTDKINVDEACGVIADISKMIFDFVQDDQE
jgi:beta-lactamase class A